MLLYHFTHSESLEDEGGTILDEGLKPSIPLNALPNSLPSPSGVVWLTASEDYLWFPYGWPKDCRLTLDIPSAHERLVRWEDWAREHAPDALKRYKSDAPGSFYCFFGLLSWRYIIAVESVGEIYDWEPEVFARYFARFRKPQT
jgi:hypothetical protein